jgi:DNA invertase Pin-like site-specific DNA recombinase
MSTAEPTNKTPKSAARAAVAGQIIQALLDKGVTFAAIAKATRVSGRTVYRWKHDGRAPHPILLESLRKLAGRHDILVEA